MSSLKCCVANCATQKGDGIPMHYFPNPKKYLDLFKTWLLQIGGEIVGLENDYIYQNRRVCSRHFEEKYFINKQKIRIKCAVPTLFLRDVHRRTMVKELSNQILPQTEKPKYSTDPQAGSLPALGASSQDQPSTSKGGSPSKVSYTSAAVVDDVITSTKNNMVHLTQEDFGTHNNECVKKFTWFCNTGASVSVISYGATVTSVLVPDKNGEIADVVLGFDSLSDYVTRNGPYLGATVGRCANRIGGASFAIDGQTFSLAKNIGENHLHGGVKGFDKMNWNSVVDGTKVTFSYLSKDGEEGYPGDLVTSVTYDVADDIDTTLSVDFLATTTKKTVVNLTNHSYFNLGGHEGGAAELYNHEIVINADKITETDQNSIPTGRFTKVGGTHYDLRSSKRLGDAIDRVGSGFDDNFCVSTYGNKGLNFVSRACHPPSGRYMEVYSDQPGVQFYTSNFLPAPTESALIGKNGVGYRRHGAFCLETQNYPDSVNKPNFPDAILKPGNTYIHRVRYHFGAVKDNRSPSVVST